MFTSISIYVVCKTKITRTFLDNLVGEDYVIKYLGVCTSSKALIRIVLPASGIMAAEAISDIPSNHSMDEKVEQLQKDHQDICGNPPPFQGILGVQYKGEELRKDHQEIVDNPLPTYPSREISMTEKMERLREEYAAVHSNRLTGLHQREMDLAEKINELKKNMPRAGLVSQLVDEVETKVPQKPFIPDWKSVPRKNL